MERETRTKKFQDYRDQLENGEVEIEETVDETDDFLSFIPSGNLEDTLSRPLTYETIEEDEDVKNAIHEARATVGKSEYDTKLDILQGLKKEEEDIDVDRLKQDDLIEGHEVTKSEKMTIAEQLSELAPEVEEPVEEVKEEIVEEVIEEPQPTKKELKKQEKEAKKLAKQQAKEQEKLEKQKAKEESKKKGSSKLAKFLDFIIIVLLLACVALGAYLIISNFM